MKDFNFELIFIFETEQTKRFKVVIQAECKEDADKIGKDYARLLLATDGMFTDIIIFAQWGLREEKVH